MSVIKHILIALFMGVLLIGGLLYSPMGWNVRVKLAENALTTRYQPYAWFFVGKSEHAQMLQNRLVQHCGYIPDINHPCF